MGIEYLQREYNRTHNGNRIFTMGNLTKHMMLNIFILGNTVYPMMGIHYNDKTTQNGNC